MKKRILAFALCIVMLFCALPFTAMADTTNVIEDSALLAYLIGEGYDYDDNGAISATEAQDIWFVQAHDMGITSLEGLQYATSLFWIDVRKNNISDISPLANLDLAVVDLGYNKISGTIDFAQLNWQFADNITLGHNEIESVLNVTTLTSALALDLSYNKLSDITELLGFTTLEKLFINNNRYSLNPSDVNYGCFAQIGEGLVEFVYVPQLVGEVTEDFILDITDAGLLEALIANGADVTGDGKISACELGNVYTALDLSNYGIEDISALAYAINTPSIDLSANKITSVSALAGLSGLTQLNIADNAVESIASLSALTALTTFNASGNKIEDIGVVENFTSLVDLDLSRNNISDVSALKSLANLKELNLSDNFISSVEFASSFDNLDLSYNVFTTVTDLVAINAGKLDITYNNLVASSVSASDFANVTTLVYENQTEYDGSYRDVVEIPDAVLLDILLKQVYINTNGDDVITKGELADFNGTLDLTGTGVTDITGLRYMKKLNILRLDNTAVSDISEMAGMIRLNILTAANSDISTLAPLAEIETLRVITVPNTKVSDIDVLRNNKLYSLTSINLEGNGITDASPLAAIPTLKTITLSSNKVSDVSFVSSLTTPENIYLKDNQIENIDAIYDLTTLKELDISHNYIDIPKNFSSTMYGQNSKLVLLRYDNQKVRVIVDIIIDVTGSNFFNMEIDGYDYGEQDYYSQKLDAGAQFTVTASPDMGEFLYWKTENGKIVSYEEKYTFIAASSVHLTAVFRQSYSNRNYVSFFTDFDQELLRELKSTASTADQITIPEGPNKTGHIFIGWTIDGKNAIAKENLATEIIAALQNGDVNLTPLYVQSDTLYTVNVINGTGGGSYLPATIIEVVANEPAQGQKFAYWIDGNGQIVGYKSSYIFIVTGDTTLEAIYTDADDEVETEALVAITDKSTNPKAGKVTFVVTRDVPTKYTIVQTGILLTDDANIGTDEDTFVIGAEGIIKGTSSSNENVGAYMATKSKVQPGDTWYARGYVVYLDTNGELVYLYSNIDSITL